MRQLFDDNSRHHDDKKHKVNRHSSNYNDAKFSGADDRLFESKSTHQTASVTVTAMQPIRNMEFERVKQKFDRPTSSTGSSTRNKKARNFSSFLKFSNKRNEIDTNETDASKLSNSNNKTHDELTKPTEAERTNECFVIATKKESFIMSNSMNLDGLKVSDNDDDEVSQKCLPKFIRKYYFGIENSRLCVLQLFFFLFTLLIFFSLCIYFDLLTINLNY